ncbi:MAG: glycosyltransferase family 87 protein [Legionella sp.]|uniref:glycosyltransferase family 87 protein n=1 Tax=Legionella sp. TaxID=459 RepID=UPI0039E256EE
MDAQINFLYLRPIVFSFIIFVYGVLFYSIITCQYNDDFTSFYSSALSAKQGNNPYQIMMSSFLPIEREIIINLNPPIMLLLISPLSYFTYPVALKIWLILSIILGLIGAWITFRNIFSQNFIKQNWRDLFIGYLFLFSSLMCLSTTQIGGLLMLCIMLGYYFYLKNYEYHAGILWGFIIALKFFPGLLLFYVLRQGRTKLFVIMLLTIALCFLMPILAYGATVYKQFYNGMTSISWYQHDWNTSVLGVIHRIFSEMQLIEWIMPTYILAVCICLMGYLWFLTPKTDLDIINHQPFCLTLVMMLVISPLGWIYYFSILLFPLLLLWTSIMKEREEFSQSAKLWLASLFFLNFPRSGGSSAQEVYYDRLVFTSFYFIGLLILLYLLTVKKKYLGSNNDVSIDNTKNSFVLYTFIILAFGFIVPSTGILLRLSRACVY